MTHEPRTQQTIYDSMRESLTGKISKLRNFTQRSFNYVWTQAFSKEIQELEAKALVTELAGWIDYTGKELTEDDIEDLGLEGNVTAEQLNKFMNDEYLDEYVKIVGVERFGGAKATGEVTITTQSDETNIPEGTVFTTALDENGEVIEFETTEPASTPDGVTTLQNVPIQAVEVGTEYNVPANEIIRMADPPIGVRSVTNPASTIGGEVEESNDELRSRAKSAVQTSSLGGTTEGIKGYIQTNVDAVREGDVIISESTDPCPPYVDVIVDGGNDDNVRDAIEFSRPTGIRHNLVRPKIIQLGWNTDVIGADIGTSNLENDIENFLLNSGIGENFYEDNFIRMIMSSDDDIINIDNLGGYIERITNEKFTYSTDVDSALADDGSNIVDETSSANDATSGDMTLLPPSPSVDNAYYFGEDEIFSKMDIAVSRAGVGTWNIVWEYYNGSSWDTLSNVTDGTSGFQSQGLGTVSWDIPNDWTSRNVNETRSLYWVRARLDSFSSISTQPLARRVEITGSGHSLDFTYEKSNGSTTVIDANDVTYTEGNDFKVIDRTGDGWPETFLWTGDTPNDGERFFVDYDVVMPGTTNVDDYYHTNLVRDEEFIWNKGYKQSFNYDKDENLHKLKYVPFDGTSSITDNSGGTYSEGTDYEIVDNSGNGLAQTIDWSIGGGSPDDDELYTITYDQKVYATQYEIEETPDGIINDESGTTYQEDNLDYELIDYNNDDEDDAIKWLTKPTNLTNGERFYMTYLTEGDLHIENADKVDPGTINVTEV